MPLSHINCVHDHAGAIKVSHNYVISEWRRQCCELIPNQANSRSANINAYVTSAFASMVCVVQFEKYINYIPARNQT